LRFIVASNIGGNPSNSYVYVDKTLTLNEWHFVVGTMENKIIKLYVDNEYIGSADTSTLVNKTENTSPIILAGARYPTYTDGLDGIVNDIRMFDHVLSIYEIKELAKAKILHYNFNTEDDFYDLSGYKNNGLYGSNVPT
jgi:hypothetical protein